MGSNERTESPHAYQSSFPFVIQVDGIGKFAIFSENFAMFGHIRGQNVADDAFPQLPKQLDGLRWTGYYNLALRELQTPSRSDAFQAGFDHCTTWLEVIAH